MEQLCRRIPELEQALHGKEEGLKELQSIIAGLKAANAELKARMEEERKIVVVTPTTLLATLRTIENIWRYERRNENARAIAEKAGAIYDKLRGLVEDLEKLGKQMDTAHATYEGVMSKLTLGQGNLIRQAGSFVELGVKVKKELPKSIMEQAGGETKAAPTTLRIGCTDAKPAHLSEADQS